MINSVEEFDDLSALEKAIFCATVCHAGQTDKAGLPYIYHPIKVSMMGKTDEERIAGALHDVLEDSDITAEDLEEMFGATIADAVVALSKGTLETYMEFIHRCAENPLARRVKINDLHHNMDLSRIWNPTHEDYERQKKYQRAMEYLLTEENADGQVDE